MTDEEKIAAFLATRGVTRVDEGVATLDRRAVYRAVRGDNALIEERHVVGDHVCNGLGEWIA